MPCTILIIQTLRHSWICLGENKTKKKLKTIQREVDLPLPVARFHDLFNGPYLLVARCFICTRIFFRLSACLALLSPWKMMIVFSGCYWLFFHSALQQHRKIDRLQLLCRLRLATLLLRLLLYCVRPGGTRLRVC